MEGVSLCPQTRGSATAGWLLLRQVRSCKRCGFQSRKNRRGQVERWLKDLSLPERIPGPVKEFKSPFLQRAALIRKDKFRESWSALWLFLAPALNCWTLQTKLCAVFSKGHKKIKTQAHNLCCCLETRSCSNGKLFIQNYFHSEARVKCAQTGRTENLLLLKMRHFPSTALTHTLSDHSLAV